MTDVSSVKAHADLQPASVALFNGPPPAFTNGSPALDGTIEEEESSTIKCICGFSDDDGATVLCEKCDTWQHIVCYYDSAHHVPDIHECTDCQPRTVDAKSATEKQRLRQRRELDSIGERKRKPPTTAKSHKKRVKDPLGSVQPNGFAVHTSNDLYYNSERKSGSPRDQPPPSKRPKTSHRTSGSVSAVSQAPALMPASRKRASSTMHNGHSPVKSPTLPDGPSEEYSIEFMNLYRQPEPPLTDSNSFTDLRVANDISSWFNDREALAEATGGKQPSEVFQRIEQSIEEIEALKPPITKQTDEDNSITVHGLHPQWHFLTVDTFVPNGAYLGELKGRIGRREDYFADPANRWDVLRHPEPFVFFPPHLPIYIDTRHEGTMLRHARRSCLPNMSMKIFTQGQEGGYHFCFTASKDIEPGEELTVGWEIEAEIRQKLTSIVNGDVRKDGLKKIEPWVACVLANFGGCACDTTRGRQCLLELARRPNNVHAEPTPPAKSTKGKKTKKSQVSPLSTGHATNSRAGSEALNRDGVEDENMDSRSTSGSHKSSSRDITPATHFSVDGEVKMSDRERRKLQQQERLFEQLEYDEQHKGKRGKRNSAGSNLNTPSLSSSRQLGHSEPSPSARGLREHSNGVARKTSGSSTKTNGRTVTKPKPVYVDISTQTEPDKSSSPAPSASTKTRVFKRPTSFKHKLLQQAREDREQRQRSASVKMEARSPALNEVTSNKPSPRPSSVAAEEPTAMDLSTDAEPVSASVVDVPVQKEESTKEPFTVPAPASEPSAVPAEPSADVEMKDSDDAATSPRPPSPKVEEMPDAPPSDIPPESTEQLNSMTEPPEPPLPASSTTTTSPPTQDAAVTATTPLQKPTDLHVQLPAAPDPNNITPSTNAVTTPGPVSGNSIAQSPLSVVSTAPSPFSPSVTNAINPGQTRKKLSLSDYSMRRKLAATNATTTTSATPPLAQSQSAESPTLSTASLPNQTSPTGKTEGESLPTPAEESKPAPAATAT